jgi:hypothetical protein
MRPDAEADDEAIGRGAKVRRRWWEDLPLDDKKWAGAEARPYRVKGWQLVEDWIGGGGGIQYGYQRRSTFSSMPVF